MSLAKTGACAANGGDATAAGNGVSEEFTPADITIPVRLRDGNDLHTPFTNYVQGCA